MFKLFFNCNDFGGWFEFKFGINYDWIHPWVFWYCSCVFLSIYQYLLVTEKWFHCYLFILIVAKPVHLRRELKLSPLICNKWANVSCYSNVADSTQCAQCISGTYDVNITWMYSNLTANYDMYEIQYGPLYYVIKDSKKPLFDPNHKKTNQRWIVSTLKTLL